MLDAMNNDAAMFAAVEAEIHVAWLRVNCKGKADVKG